MEQQTGNKYGFGVEMSGSFADAIPKVKEALKTQGFGVLSEIDVQKTLKEKTGQEIEPYTILGACNPGIASRALEAEHEIGLLLPCNVLVHECGGRVRVAIQDPRAMLAVTQNEALRPFMEDARSRLQKVLESLK